MTTEPAAAPEPSDDELTVHTERLLLRPVAVDDATALFEHASDPELPRQMTWAAHASVAQTREFLASCVAEREAGREFVWVIEESGRVAGLVGVEGVVRGVLASRFDRAELGYWLGRDFRGRGLMTEAARAALEMAFGVLALHKVTVHAFSENHASLRVIEKLGFTRVGRKREDVRKDGVWHDQIAYEMLSGELAPDA